MPSNQSITERDLEIVVTLYKYRYLKTSQIQQLYFPSAQTANRRMRSLIDQKLVKHFSVPNVPERIYFLSQNGAKVVAEQLDTTLEEMLWSKNTNAPKDYYFMQHFLATNQFRIDVTKSCDDSDIDLLGFIPEYYGSKTPSGRIRKHITDFALDISNPNDKINHTPDAVFALQKQNKPALFFLEIDRGTEVLSNPEKGFLKMLRYYLGYAKAGKFKSYQQEFDCGELSWFRLLIVTSSQKRFDNMRENATDYFETTTKALRYFWLTTFQKTEFGNPLADHWQSLDVSDDNIYSMK